MRHNSARHWNDHLLAAVHLETTGPRAGYHEITKLQILPLTSDLKQSNRLAPLNLDIKPAHPGRRVNSTRYRAGEGNITPEYQAFETFMAWFKRLKLDTEKAIMPLCFDWATMFPHIQSFCMWDEDNETNFCSDFFTTESRSMKPITVFYNDLAFSKGLKYPFSALGTTKNSKSILTTFGVKKSDCHNLYHHCLDSTAAYKQLIKIGEGFHFE